MAQATTTIDTQTLSREIAELDRLLHRIRERIEVSSVSPRIKSKEEVQKILKRTGGVLRNKIGSEEEVVAWQRKIRAEWES